MHKLSLIAAVDENFGLGKNNQLLCYLPADLAYFKKSTLGKTIIMGKKTFQSIGKPLPGRQNIILSHLTTAAQPGYLIASSINNAIALASSEEIVFIGGAEIYAQALPLVDEVLLTHIHHSFDADVYFPAMEMKNWHCSQQIFHPNDEKNAYAMTFSCYQRIPKSSLHPTA